MDQTVHHCLVLFQFFRKSPRSESKNTAVYTKFTITESNERVYLFPFKTIHFCYFYKI